MLNQASGQIRGSVLGGGVGGGAVSQEYGEMPKTAEMMPVDFAMDNLHKELVYMHEQAKMLLGRLHSVTAPAPAGKDQQELGQPSSCQLEGNINSARSCVSEVTEMLRSAREALCI